MQIKIRFLGVLSVRYGADPIMINSNSDYDSINIKIRDLIGADGPVNYVILKNGKPAVPSEPLKDDEELLVFSPISGG